MIYDFNIEPGLNLDESGFDGFCVTQKYSDKLTWDQFPTSKKIYKKVEVDYNKIQNLKNIKNHDVLCVKMQTHENLEKVIDQEPDLITFNLNVQQKFNVKHLRMAVKRKVYIEIPLNYKNKMVYLYNVTELLRILRYRNIVFGSGAKTKKELKEPSDIIELLSFLGFNKNKIQKVLENSEKLLKLCAMRRHSFKNCIINDVGIVNPSDKNNEESKLLNTKSTYSSLKNDFLNNFFNL